MKRKVYRKPSFQVIKVNFEELLAASGGTGATIPDAGWGNAKRIQRLEDDCNEDEN